MAIIISGNNISDSGKDGIHVSGKLDLVIGGNTIERSGEQAINVEQQYDAAELDDETKKLLVELRDALNNKDSSQTKKVFGAIVDKGVDIAIAIAAG